MLYHVIYSSKASQPMTATALEGILADARAGNQARDITGVLVYADGVFLQILEGEEATVRSLMANIGRDPRHEAVKVFHEERIDTRAFDSWSMAYLSANAAKVADWAGLEGTDSIDGVLDQVRRDPRRVPAVLVKIVEALAAT